jgi:putative membrane protein
MRRIALVLGAALIGLAPVMMIEPASTVLAAASVSGEEFVKTAGVAGMFEIDSSKIAATKSSNGDVKAFAQRMISDHTKAAEELKTVAKSAGDKYVLPTALDPDHQKMIDELNKADPSKFDATYVRMQTDAHKDAVALFGDYSKQGDEPKLREFAAKTLPVLQDHYDMIKRVAASQNVAQTNQPAKQDQSSGSTVSGLGGADLMLASKLIGSTLYSSANENVGDVNDIVIDKSGNIRGVVVGVGGFLGLGEKDVLVPLDRIQFGRDESNNMKFTITATRQELEQAPSFDRKHWTTTNP